MWRYEFLKFKFEISKCDFDMFSYVFIRFRNKISIVWKFCWRHPLEQKFYVRSGIVPIFCFGKFKQLLTFYKELLRPLNPMLFHYSTRFADLCLIFLSDFHSIYVSGINSCRSSMRFIDIMFTIHNVTLRKYIQT